MKLFLTFCFVITLSFTCGTAQDFSAALPFVDADIDAPLPEEAEHIRREKVEYFETKQSTDGIIIRVLRTINPLRLLDIRAPKEYGNGEDTVSRDPNDSEKKAKGFILLSKNW